MSLLLDALKRAEQEKLARGDRPDLQVVGHGDPPAAASAPAPKPQGAAVTSLELQPLSSAAAAAAAASTPPGHAAPAPSAKPQTPAQAQVVFQAKAPQESAGGKRFMLYVGGAAIAIAIIAAAAYVWYAMAALAPKPAPAPRPAAFVPRPAPAAGTITPATPGLPPFSPERPAPAAPPAAVTQATAPTPAPVIAAAPPAARAVEAKSSEQLAQDLLREAPRREAPVRLDRTQEPSRLSTEVVAAYEALRRGDFAGAQRGYAAALAAEPTNLDALLGTATIEARQGSVAGAARAYRQALDLDPRNETALAGLAALADVARPGTVEAQLRQDVMHHPNSAGLRFALGNSLAAQGRWTEAQAEYFEAHRLDPGNADVAYNLAVALDHLGQSRPAADFYRRALESARAQPGQFNPASVQRRLAELTR